MSDKPNRPVASKIIIVEDEMIFAKDLSLTLQDLGYEVIGTVRTGELAVQFTQESKPDLVLMDIKLGGEIDGIQASVEIRARFDIPVIFLTAHGETDVSSRAKVSEPYGFLAKPVSHNVLKSTIETVLYKHAADKRVRESEERYRILVEQSIDGIGLAQGTTVRFVNRALARMFGCQSPEEMVGQNFLTFVAPEDRDLIEKRVRDREAGKSVIDYYEFKALRKDGSTFDAEVRDSLTTYRGDKVRQGIIRDVTERKQAEEALRESEERFRKVFEQGPIGMGLVGTEGRFLAANSQLCQMLGYREDELTRLTFVDITHPEHLTQDREAVRRLYAGEIPYYKVEKRYVKKDGDILWGNLTAAVIRNAEGKLLYALPMIEDITDRKRAEEELYASEERLNLALAGANLGMWDWDLTTGKALWSERNYTMLGYEPNEFGPDLKNWKKLVHPDDWPMVSETLNLYLQGRLPKFEILYRAPNKSGEWQWLQAQGTVTEFGADGKPTRITGVVADVTERKKVEQALRGSEAKYKVLVEESFDGIFVQKGTKIVFTNSRLREMLGYEEGELEGQYHWLVYHPEYQEITRERAKARLRGEPAPPRYEVRMQRKDGSSFEAEINARAVEFVGEPGIQVWIRDISERKRAENALQESEERFRTAFQTSPDAVLITRLSDGVCIEANKGFAEISGFTREEVIGKSLLEISLWHDPKDRNRLIAELNERGEVTNFEALFRHKEGRIRTGLMSARIIVLGGEPHVLSVSRDVQDWKKAEQAIRESEEKYRTLFEESRDAVIMTTRDGVVEEANQAYLDLFGFTREELRGMDILKIYPNHEDRRRFQQDIERDGSVKDYQVKRRKKDGTEIDCLLTSTVRRDKNGKILGYQGIIRDVTEQKMVQSQLVQAQKMEAIGTLAGGIAHDFNNLLQAILGYTEILLMKKEPGDSDRKKLEVIQHAARDGADLVSRILAFSKKSESKVRPIDLNQELSRIERLLRRTLPRMIKIDLVLSDALKIIDADPAQIEQVILNLGVNAQHAMPDGGQLLIETSNVSISTEYLLTHLGAKRGKYVLLTVSDTGTGMAPEVLERIFEPFFTTKTNAEGTGLGLSMVLGIVTQHGGYIRCYSEPGRGTSFKIYFPVSKTEGLWELAETREMPAFGTETILVVDDDDRVRDIAKQMIQMGGYQVLTARSGEEALKIYAGRREEIALVILDLIMPGMGGKRCLEELLRIGPDSRVLLASGYSSNGLTLDETGSGARGFITKPYDARDILAAIRKVLDRGHL